MEKFQLSVGLNNGWLCNTVAEIPVDPVQEKKSKLLQGISTSNRLETIHLAQGDATPILHLV